MIFLNYCHCILCWFRARNGTCSEWFLLVFCLGNAHSSFPLRLLTPIIICKLTIFNEQFVSRGTACSGLYLSTWCRKVLWVIRSNDLWGILFILSWQACDLVKPIVISCLQSFGDESKDANHELIINISSFFIHLRNLIKPYSCGKFIDVGNLCWASLINFGTQRGLARDCDLVRRTFLSYLNKSYLSR